MQRSSSQAVKRTNNNKININIKNTNVKTNNMNSNRKEEKIQNIELNKLALDLKPVKINSKTEINPKAKIVDSKLKQKLTNIESNITSKTNNNKSSNLFLNSNIKQTSGVTIKNTNNNNKNKIINDNSSNIFSGGKKYKTNFGYVYSAGGIPCRIMHTGVKLKLKWSIEPEGSIISIII